MTTPSQSKFDLMLDWHRNTTHHVSFIERLIFQLGCSCVKRGDLCIPYEGPAFKRAFLLLDRGKSDVSVCWDCRPPGDSGELDHGVWHRVQYHVQLRLYISPFLITPHFPNSSALSNSDFDRRPWTKTFSMLSPDISQINVVAILGTSIFVYCIVGVLYRLYFHPLSKFPGPKLAAATLWSEFYYDCIQSGQYFVKIAQWHERYGMSMHILGGQIQPYWLPCPRFNRSNWTKWDSYWWPRVLWYCVLVWKCEEQGSILHSTVQHARYWIWCCRSPCSSNEKSCAQSILL